MDLHLTEYDKEVLEILEEHVSEYGSKDWPIDTRHSISYIVRSLGASAELQRYIGGILYDG